MSTGIYGPAAFDEMLDFARRCAGTRMDTVLSVVDVISPEDIAVCREIAEKVGAPAGAGIFRGMTAAAKQRLPK